MGRRSSGLPGTKIRKYVSCFPCQQLVIVPVLQTSLRSSQAVLWGYLHARTAGQKMLGASILCTSYVHRYLGRETTAVDLGSLKAADDGLIY